MQDQGIIVVNKDLDISSFAVVSRLRKILGLKRIGHAGTLDPFATGVLPVALGRATGAIQFMQNYDKTYEVLAVLGSRTDSGDREGQLIAQTNLAQLEACYQELKTGRLAQSLVKHQGQIKQLPPMYSALKYQGRPLYAYAREGKEVARDPRQVQVKVEDWRLLTRSELTDFANSHSYELRADLSPGASYFLYAKLQVSKGTYIRTWVDDLGEDLGLHAYCENLRRVQCGPFNLESAPSTEELFEIWRSCGKDAMSTRENLQQLGYLRPLLTAFSDWPQLALDFDQALAITQGKCLDISSHSLASCLASELADEPSADFASRLVLTYDGQMLAMGQALAGPQGYYIKSMRVFASHEDLRRA